MTKITRITGIAFAASMALASISQVNAATVWTSDSGYAYSGAPYAYDYGYDSYAYEPGYVTPRHYGYTRDYGYARQNHRDCLSSPASQFNRECQ
jgi:hypothetical protein